MAGMTKGVLLPVITPFVGGKVDIETYKKLLVYYLGKGIHGIIPLGTTGESPTIEEDEYNEIVEATIDVAKDMVPIYVGVSSNSTRKAIHQIENLNLYNISGYLVTSPYYNLPSQQGIFEHFAKLADATDKQILIYNIPYRTGRNVENETILRLSKVPNIVGIKDSCGIVSQSIELLRDRDPQFAIFTGEDMLFYFNIVSGGNGGILASAHLQTDRFVRVWESVQQIELKTALLEWHKLTRMIPLLFTEPNPAPIKYILAKKGIIASAELRPPMGTISEGLRIELDRFIIDESI
ncbi:MAG: 4-hydroxy-tetrahydrodipicolinate synthase [Spirochaetia bacterium]